MDMDIAVRERVNRGVGGTEILFASSIHFWMRTSMICNKKHYSLWYFEVRGRHSLTEVMVLLPRPN